MHKKLLSPQDRACASQPQGTQSAGGSDPAACPTASLLIAQLGTAHRKRIAAHLLSLPAGDRRLRFGYTVSDISLTAYVRSLRFSRDAAFGGFDEEGRLLAFAHLAFDADQHSAELGLSVAPEARRRGAGLALLDRAATHARNRGRDSLVMAYVPENDALASLARRAGMQMTHDPVEPRAYLSLEAATPASVLQEAFGEAIAALDLGFRVGNAASPLTSA
jgi:ribosomal protein S18 acetylase RimI-like enzyme